MIIYFDNKVSENLEVEFLEKEALSDRYYTDRDKVWESKKQQVESNGGTLWNGEIITFQNIKYSTDTDVRLQLGLCEYKDVIYILSKSPEFVASEYGKNHVLCSAFVVTLLITSDKKLVVGFTNSSTAQAHGKLHIIGGNLNNDETSVKNFSDITAHALKEINEETSFGINASSLHFHSLNLLQGRCMFLYYSFLDIQSDALTSAHKDEFQSLSAMTIQELKDFTGNKSYVYDYLLENTETLKLDELLARHI